MTSRYVILTPFDNAPALAGVLKLRGVDADVIPTKSGVLVIKDLPQKSFDDWDISELLGDAPGEQRPLDEEAIENDADTVAAFLSTLSRFGVVQFTANLGEDVGLDSGVSGQVTALRFLNGRKDEEISAGLLINSLDPIVERVILGEVTADDVAEGIKDEDVNDSFFHRMFRRSGNNKPAETGNDAINRRANEDEQ